MSVRNYTIAIDDRAGVSPTELLDRLREARFTVTQHLPAIGVIVGRAEEDDVVRIRSIRGVTAVEAERMIEPRPAGLADED